jgi:hypothetical protein
VPFYECSSGTRFQVFLEGDGCLFARERKMSHKDPRVELGRVWRSAFIVLFKSLSQIASLSHVLLLWMLL